MHLLLLAACTGPVDTDPLPLDTSEAFETDVSVEEPWVLIPGGTFLMGSAGPDAEYDEQPQHEVTVGRFAILRHEVLVSDYAGCVADGVCTLPDPGCFDPSTPPNTPMTCIDWIKAADVCWWLGGRLPSESEWEFAATSRGTADTEYPWGDEPYDCTRANTGLAEDGGASCGSGEGPWLPCTHPAGDTPLGLCEMGGNVFEWTADFYWDDYTGHPTDGSARTDMLFDFRVMRGGGVGSIVEPRVRERTYHPTDFYYGGMGARCAMDL
ncbi:MAG: SUMF1/EgtB/PvdO family nonheme iron enzyme [Myxococcota bacterium]